MYSQTEIDEAVAAGALTPKPPPRFARISSSSGSTPTADEEQFRLITGFNDIFVSIAAAILLFAVGFIGQSDRPAHRPRDRGDGPSFLGPASQSPSPAGRLPCSSRPSGGWRLPSILLLLAFIGSVSCNRWHRPGSALRTRRLRQQHATGGIVAPFRRRSRRLRPGCTGSASASRSPSPPARPPSRRSSSAWSSPRSASGWSNAQNFILGFVLLLGIGMFLFAMWWDGSDRARLTRRADVAFWLHLLAAPMIVHPVFTLLGLNDGNATIGEGLVVILLYVVIGLTALAIDRRALARLGARLRALRAQPTVRAVRRGRAERRADGADHRIGAADAVGLLASGPVRWSSSRCRPAARPAAAGRSCGAYSSTSRISRRSSGARTAGSSWPRLSTRPCSLTKANAPCFSRSSGRFSMRTSGRSDGAPERREDWPGPRPC